MSDCCCCLGSIVYLFLGLIPVWYTYRWWVAGRKYEKDNKITGKVVIITGSNTGIGKESAIELARRGAKIYLACRSLERGEEARLDVISQSANRNVFLRQLDLASFKSIKTFAEKFLKEETRLDILISNAGVMACPRALTEEGFEMQLGTNHIGHFYLTSLLLPLIKKSAPARIINVSSKAHERGKIYKTDLMLENRYEAFKSYSQSKLANVLYTKELARRLKETNVTVYSLHPGAIFTDLSRHLTDSYGRLLGGTFAILAPYLLKNCKEGAQTTLTCALDPELEKVTGEYFDNCQVTHKVNPLVNDSELAIWLWNETEKIVNAAIKKMKD